MEGIISFLENYWGYTVVGGFTIGALVTNAVALVKSIRRTKLRDAEYKISFSDLSAKFTELMLAYDAAVKENSDLRKQVEYNNRVQALTFKSLAYLTMSSKLPIEEKLALQKEYATINDNVVEVVKEVEEDIDKLKDNEEVVTEAVAQTEDILNRYIGDK